MSLPKLLTGVLRLALALLFIFVGVFFLIIEIVIVFIGVFASNFIALYDTAEVHGELPCIRTHVNPWQCTFALILRSDNPRTCF
ncbi:MAG: hypothetical protein WCF67_01100 [Chitinophagaceae bacterium]